MNGFYAPFYKIKKMEKIKYNYSNHIMVDIETLDVGSHPVILQIAAVRFNPITGQTFEEFNEYVSIQSCLDEGLTISEDTLHFWSQQDHGLFYKTAFGYNRSGIREALEKFSEFVHEIKTTLWEEPFLWGKSPSFDIAKISNICDKLEVGKSWMFWKERDVRTILSFDNTARNMKFEGEVHNAIDDCKHQIKQVNRALTKIFS